VEFVKTTVNCKELLAMGRDNTKPHFPYKLMKLGYKSVTDEARCVTMQMP